MIANFHINYGTLPGEQIAIRFKKNGTEETVICQSYDATNWHETIQVAETDVIAYKYFLQTPKGMVGEHGEYRQLFIPKDGTHVSYQNYWRPQFEVARSFFSAAFKDVIFRRKGAESIPPKPRQKRGESTGNKIIFQLYAAAIPQHLKFCVCGNNDALGNWKKPVVLSEGHYPNWQVELDWNGQSVDIEYKFAIYNPENQQVVEWEKGLNRRLQFTFPSAKGNAVVRTDESYQYASGLWKGAGMAIPVFSLRSENGCGIGEYTDLNLLVDWATKTGMKLVQTLPVNDTIATKTWTDSYPYAAISVYALHPLYVNIQSIAKLKTKQTRPASKRQLRS
ncbi:MAG: 4-alpha-glucanotransferase [Saprospiraceae bacterium]|nr:4-alpha-glucanotransferase [Saprospiraceae bacterium]